ncbi:LytR family transcriptional regulator [Corynebacterium sp. zg912]|uniref:LytR family transcriptional regulator n=1 Tax=Corynebacterium wankanglinii TaxID=2735136 RepID=A0A7V8UUW2_9CORY|nr:MULTISPECIES: LCP family protein [Corynebacterium]MBA1837767.1 LytR family transcriptional regulator [Corynebacterium wankanglinii]MCR5929128.1 LytR family transcriptional regulator [Corynebacterium sp. zg912]
MSTTPHSNDPRDNAGEFVLGKDGKPLVDRYGRPIRRRTTASRRDPAPRHPDEFTRVEPRARRVPSPVSARVEPGHTVYEPPTAYEPRRAPEHPRSRPVQQRPAPRPSSRPAPEDVPLQVSRRRRRGPKGRRKVKLPGCGAVLALVIALLIGSVLVADARLNRTAAMPDQQISNTSGTNWLLVGSDSRTGLSEKDVERLGTGGDLGTVRTDTIMLMHLPLRGKPTLVSIPRDSYVSVPGYGYDKINAAFSIGGPQLLVETVEQNTGLHVDRYAEIGMGGLAGVVDAAGGVEICVDEPIDDPLANINLQPGCQQMDGPTALGYVRTRATAQGDLDRVARQREFMTTLVTRVLSPSVYLNPFRMARLLWVTPTLLTVNSDDHAWNLARILIALRGGLETETVPIGGFTDTEVGNVVLWDDTAAEALFASLR